LGRVFASQLSDRFGQLVIFENVGGAGGMTGSNRVAKAPPGGYQFVLGGTFMALNQLLYKKPLYNAATDFEPVTLIVEQPAVLLVRNDLPPQNLAEFIAYAKTNQARMQYGSGGVGSAPHLACALLGTTIGVNITHVPYRSASGPLQDTIAGRLDYFCTLAALAIPQIQSGTVRPIAIFSKTRLPVLPQVATAHEQGLADFEVVPWYAFFLPKGTPAPIVQKLRDASVAVMEAPAVHAKLADLGYTIIEPERRSPDVLQKLMESEINRWRIVIKNAGITPD
jgi:tripartite-type tricarboxylate transporter receptor subunit TctC